MGWFEGRRASRREELGDGYLLPGLITFVVVVALYSAVILFESPRGFTCVDSVIYLIVARNWVQGLIPYLDLVDHKPPGIYLWFALSQSLFGESIDALWDGLTLSAGLAAAALAGAFLVLGRIGGAVAATFLPIVILYSDTFGARQLNTEVVAANLVLGALSLVMAYLSRARVWLLFLSGFLLGGAFLTKQPAGFFVISPLAMIVVKSVETAPGWGRRVALATGHGGALFFGAGVPLLLTALYFEHHHAFLPFLDWAFLRNLNYAGIPSFESKTEVVQSFLSQAKDRIDFVGSLGFSLALLMMAGTFIFRRSVLDLFWGTVLVAGILASISVNGIFWHYLLFLYPALLLAGVLAVDLLTRATCHRFTSPVCELCGGIVVTVALFGSTIASGIEAMSRYEAPPRSTWRHEDAENLAKLVDSSVGGIGTLYVWSGPLELYLYSTLRMGGRYFYGLDAKLGISGMERVREIEERKPTAIVLNPHDAMDLDNPRAPELFALGKVLQESYVLLNDDKVGTAFIRRAAIVSASSPPTAGRNRKSP